MRKALRWLGRTLVVMLVGAGIFQVGSTAIWLWELGQTSSDGGLPSVSPAFSSPSTPTMTVVLLNQPPLPSEDVLIDKNYPMKTSLLINAGRGVLKVQGKLKGGEKLREGKFLMLCEPGKTARLYVPVETNAIAEGWRPIELLDTECVFTVPRTHSSDSTGTMIAKQ